MKSLVQGLMSKSKKKQKGMTLVELLAVIVILGIVAGIGTIAIGNIIKNSKDNSDDRKEGMIIEAAKLYVLDGGDISTGSITVATLKSEGYFDGDAKLASDSTKSFDTVTITDTDNNGVNEYSVSTK